MSTVDIAIIPYWYYNYDEGRAIIETHLKAPVRIAAHIPPSEVEAVRRKLAIEDPQCIVFDTFGESIER